MDSVEPATAEAPEAGTLGERSVLDRVTKAAALRLSRRRFAGNVLAGGTVAWAVQLLGFTAPPVYADECNFCCGSGCGACHACSPTNCCSPSGQWCQSQVCCDCNPECNCGGLFKAVLGNLRQRIRKPLLPELSMS